MKNATILLVLCLTGLQVFAQNYNAVHGSNYAGSLGTGNNPASIVNTPYKWDVDLFSFQLTNSSNAVTVYNYSLLSPGKESLYLFDSGYYNRYGSANFNINLLNTRIALNRRQAVAFGINLRGYAQAKADPYYFIDTVGMVRDFLKMNNNIPLQGDFTGSSWIELFGTYSQTIIDNGATRLNAGVTLRLSRGVAGGYAKANDIRFLGTVTDNQTVYKLQSGQGEYGYSSNFDNWNDDKENNDNLNELVKRSQGGLSVDLGVEYLIKPMGTTRFDEDDYYDYDWKIGASLLDLGFNQYQYGLESYYVANPKDNVYDSTFDQKFFGVESLAAANDSLATLVNTMRPLRGKFKVFNPARLVINADRPLGNDFFINGELSLNLSPLLGDKHLYVSNLKFLTVTPRWETRRWGVYLPIQYNNEGRLWVGGAFKLGPLLLGIHNWGNIFSKEKIQDGGGYLALIIRAWNGTNRSSDKRYSCPSF